MAGSIQAPYEKRRGEIERQRSVQGRPHRIVGRFPASIPSSGGGEGVVTVNFPLWFIDVPSASFGGELDVNQVLVDGYFPTISCLVKSWRSERKTGKSYYVGADLIVVTMGAPNQRLIVHWQMEGKALVNPLLQAANTNTVI